MSDVLEISLWVRSVDVAEQPVRMLYREPGGDWDEFLLFHMDTGWDLIDLTSNLRSSGTPQGIQVYGGGPGHMVRIDDVKIMADDAGAAESSAWERVKAMYR